jgi:hypothetical protein
MSQPIYLVTSESGTGVRIEVVGETSAPVTARYELVASSGTGNRSVQRGDVRLTPGQRVVLLSLGMGNADTGWTARLKVERSGGSYEQVAGTK